jgi:hypothetical protein
MINTASQNIGGSSTSAFYNLGMNGTGGATLGIATSIDGTLTLNLSKIDIGNYNLTIAPTGTISGGSSTSYIKTSTTGRLKQQIAGLATKNYPVGKSVDQSLVENLSVSGQNLSWTYTGSNVLFAVYAVPNANRNDVGIFASSKYLLGMAYNKQFTLPTAVNSSTHKIAVSVVDRFKNEFAARVMGENPTTAIATNLTFPSNNAQTLIPCLFKWDAINSADSYVWQVARDAQFTDLVCSRETVQAQFFSGLQTNLKDNTDYYWRVRTRKANAVDVWSIGQKFTTNKFGIVSPVNNASAVSLMPTITWDNVSATASYTIEIATTADFSVAKQVFKQTTTNTSVTLSAGILLSSTNYFVRVSVSDGIVQATSETIVFTTQEAFIPIPQLTKPITGATLNGTSIEVCWAQQASNGFRIELAKDATFPARGTTLKTVDANTYCTTFDALTAATYFIRVKALTSTGLTEASNISSVVLSGQTHYR